MKSVWPGRRLYGCWGWSDEKKSKTSHRLCPITSLRIYVNTHTHTRTFYSHEHTRSLLFRYKFDQVYYSSVSVSSFGTDRKISRHADYGVKSSPSNPSTRDFFSKVCIIIIIIGLFFRFYFFIRRDFFSRFPARNLFLLEISLPIFDDTWTNTPPTRQIFVRKTNHLDSVRIQKKVSPVILENVENCLSRYSIRSRYDVTNC